MSCSINLLNDFFTNFNEIAFKKILEKSLSDEKNVPSKFGISFGECTTVCGSLGITEIDFLENLDVQTDTSTIEFLTCGHTDSAIVRFPIFGDVKFTLLLRASGKGTLWPIDNHIFNDAFASLSGEILIKIPIVNKSLQFSKLSVSVNFLSNWTDETLWPDQNNILFERVPLNSLLKQWTSILNNTFAKNLEKYSENYALVPDLSINCTFPITMPMVCTKEMALDSQALTPVYCHPCDKCCKCFMQQRCDFGCENCACINCSKSSLKNGLLFVTVLILIACFLLLRKCINISLYN